MPDASESRFGSDDGSADPRVAAALAAFAAGSGTEHAVLTLLAAARLLVPLMAAPSEQVTGGGKTSSGGKTSTVALPTLIGTDGRRAVPAFTSLDALTRWRPGARLVPAQAGLVWRAAVADCCAVVIDVAGPVPLAVEGTRLAALARGEPVPLPHEDPDMLAEVVAVVGQQPAPAGIRLAPGDIRLAPGDADGELVIQLMLPAGADAAGTADLVARVGNGVMARLGGRLRAGIAVAVIQAAPDQRG